VYGVGDCGRQFTCTCVVLWHVALGIEVVVDRDRGS
jgi:hypothetical protein